MLYTYKSHNIHALSILGEQADDLINKVLVFNLQLSFVYPLMYDMVNVGFYVASNIVSLYLHYWYIEKLEGINNIALLPTRNKDF